MNVPDHKLDLEYARVSLGVVDAAFHVEADADGVTLTGTCPRCHGPTSSRFPKGMAGSKGFPWSKDRPPSQAEQAAVVDTEPLFCECGFTHTGQPESTGFDGCGAQWRLKTGSGGAT
jgi:hypothetical protein